MNKYIYDLCGDNISGIINNTLFWSSTKHAQLWSQLHGKWRRSAERGYVNTYIDRDIEQKILGIFENIDIDPFDEEDWDEKEDSNDQLHGISIGFKSREECIDIVKKLEYMSYDVAADVFYRDEHVPWNSVVYFGGKWNVVVSIAETDIDYEEFMKL